MPSDERQIIEQAKFLYFPLGKAFEKQTKTIEHQHRKQFRVIEGHGKQLAESHELIKKCFNSSRDDIPLEEQKNIYLMNLLKKNPMNLNI